MSRLDEIQARVETAEVTGGEVCALLEVARAVPPVANLHSMVRWLDLIDQFAAMADPTYVLPRDEIQKDLLRLAGAVAALEEARS